jgi:hypothetical protein
MRIISNTRGDERDARKLGESSERDAGCDEITLLCDSIDDKVVSRNDV